jgi:hypothetical protein
MSETPQPPQNPYDAQPSSTPPGPEPEPTRQAPVIPPPPPSDQQAPPSPHPDGPAQSTDAVGFLRALFDFSFSTFITPKVVRFVYILATALLALAWLTWLVVAFAVHPGYGLFVLLIGPIVMLVYLALIRMTLEFYLAITRMSEDVHQRLPPRG